jgi:hypothetical protein
MSRLEKRFRNKKSGPKAIGAARKTHFLMIKITGIITVIALLIGGYAIYLDKHSPTEINFWGAKITTGHVGVACLAIAFMTFLFTMRGILKNLKDLGKIKD